jgi:hypothetical protein
MRKKPPTMMSLTTAAAAMGRKGGKASSPAKTAANRANVKKRWARYAATKRAEAK